MLEFLVEGMGLQDFRLGQTSLWWVLPLSISNKYLCGPPYYHRDKSISESKCST